MSRPIAALIYLLFILSGAAALVYEVVWFRSFSHISGGLPGRREVVRKGNCASNVFILSSCVSLFQGTGLPPADPVSIEVPWKN